MQVEALKYMAFSGIIYSDFSNLTTDTIHPSIEELLRGNKIKDALYDQSTQEINFLDSSLCKLSSMGAYRLLSYQSLPSGLTAAAFQAPDNPDGTKGILALLL